MKYNCINFEGLDQVGKGDAVKNLSLEIAKNGYRTCVISFPYYATPIGYIIRDFLVNGFPKGLKLSKRDEIETKMAIFALNRLEILSCIVSNKEFDVYVFDRGPYSAALTIGYHIFQNKKEFMNVVEYVNKGLEFDKYFREILNTDNCVIYLKHKGIEWKRSRSLDNGDLYERLEVQDISSHVYDIMEKRVGEGWNTVITKDINGWRSRDDIKGECIEFVKERKILTDNEKRASFIPVYLGVEQIIKSLYAGSKVEDDISGAWMSAIMNNDKKEVYRVSEIVSNGLVATTELLSWSDENLSEYIKDLIRKFPHISDIIEYKYGGMFKDKFIKSLK